MAAEENNKVRERAETAGTTAAGTAGRAEGLSVKGVSGGSRGNLYFNSGSFGYSNRTLTKGPNDPGNVIRWLRSMELFLGSEGFGAHNDPKSHLPCLHD